MRTMAGIRYQEGRMPTLDEMKDFYEGIASPRPSDGWFGSTHHIGTDLARVSFALKHTKPGDAVLEAGCADCGLSRHLLSAALPGGFFTGIDLAPTFLARGQDYLNKHHPRGSFDLLLADAATFTTRRRFDVVVAMEILEHVPDPRAVLANLWGLLRKRSGKLLISVPYKVEDALGEHIHEFDAKDVQVIIGDATGAFVPVLQEGQTLLAVVDKENVVPYVP